MYFGPQTERINQVRKTTITRPLATVTNSTNILFWYILSFSPLVFDRLAVPDGVGIPVRRNRSDDHHTRNMHDKMKGDSGKSIKIITLRSVRASDWFGLLARIGRLPGDIAPPEKRPLAGMLTPLQVSITPDRRETATAPRSHR